MGSRYSFAFKGSAQGFVSCPYENRSYDVVTLSNLNVSSDENGLAIDYKALAPGIRCSVSTPVFLDFSVLADNFSTIASPTLYSSQIVVAHIKAFAEDNPGLKFFILYYDQDNEVRRIEGDPFA